MGEVSIRKGIEKPKSHALASSLIETLQRVAFHQASSPLDPFAAGALHLQLLGLPCRTTPSAACPPSFVLTQLPLQPIVSQALWLLLLIFAPAIGGLLAEDSACGFWMGWLLSRVLLEPCLRLKSSGNAPAA